MSPGTTRQLYRSREHRLLAGVAGGLGEYLGVKPIIIRIVWIVLGLLMPPMSTLLILLIYIFLAVAVPLSPLA